MKSKNVNTPIRVLQVMDKCAIRNSPIHGVSRLLLTWWPGFEGTNIELFLSVSMAKNNTCEPFTKKGIYVNDLGRGKLDPRIIVDLIKLIKKHDIHILHCHGYGATTFGRIAGLLTRTPVIVHEHMIDEKIPLYQQIVDWMLSPFTAKGIAISKAVQKFMVNKRHISQNKMDIVHNTIPDKYFNHPTKEQKEKVASKYNLRHSSPLIGIVGRLDPVKGHIDFLKAAQRVIEKWPDANFVIVGDGEIRTELEAKSESLNIDKNVKFLGHCNEIHEIVSLLDILVISSHQEGFSLAAIEAMALGKPIVATSVGGLPEVIDNNSTGILVKPHKPQEIANAIKSILTDSTLAKRLGEKGKEKCRNQYSLSSCIEKLSCIYSSIIR